MKNLNEDYKNLNELIRTAYKLISPMTYHDDVNRLTPEFVMDDAKKRPGCYLKLGQGADHTLFPICNRYGYKDPKMIKFSLKLAKKVAERNIGHDTTTVIIKLQKLLNKYNKTIPNTNSQAALKGQATKTFNKKMKISEAGQSKANEKLEEWGNSDLNADDRAKKFVQDMYNIKENAKEKSVNEAEGALKKITKRYYRRATGQATMSDKFFGKYDDKPIKDAAPKVGIRIAAVGIGAIALKKLYDKYKSEKDPKKKAVIKAKILKAKKAKK